VPLPELFQWREIYLLIIEQIRVTIAIEIARSVYSIFRQNSALTTEVGLE
jgi:hypothetical protein